MLKRLLSRYTVSVQWENLYRVHYAKSVADALEWAACYPVDAQVIVHRNLNGMIVAARG